MSRNFFIVLSLAILLSLVAGSPVAAQSDDELDPLVVTMRPFLSFAPFMIADAEDYFIEQGLDVEFVSMEGSAALTPLLLGEVDVAAGALSFGHLNAIARGGNLRVVADKGNLASEGCAATALLIRSDLMADGELVDPEALRGGAVSIEFDESEGFYIEPFLAELGLGIEDLVVEDLPPPTMAEASPTTR